MPPKSDPLTIIDKQVGKVLMVKLLGQGGMGVVYQGRHLLLDKTVAVKFLPVSPLVSDELRERFLREARSAASLEHPNIVQILDVDQTDQYDYIIMQFVEGKSLQKLLFHEEKLEVDNGVRLLIQALDALQFAHNKGIVHRDIKPDNLMVTPEGALKVADFGLARLHNEETMTNTNLIMGTPEYMAPEQAETARVDHRADIYSLGITFYVALSGIYPFPGDGAVSVIVNKIKLDLPPIVDYADHIPGKLARIIEKMCHRDVEERYQSCGQVLNDLKGVEELSKWGVDTSTLVVDLKPLLLPEDPEPVDEGKKISLTPPILAGLMVAVLFLVGLGFVLNQQATDQKLEREKAQMYRKHFQSAGEAMEKGELERALVAVNQALAAEPEDVEAEKLRREIHRRIDFQKLVTKARQELYEKMDYTGAEKIVYQAQKLLTQATRDRDETRIATTKELLGKIRLKRGDDRYEPNDFLNQARVLELGEYGKLNLLPDNDDWYQIEVKEDGFYEIALDFPVAKGDLDLEVYDSKRVIITRGESTGDGEKLVVLIPAGPVYIRVYSKLGQTNQYRMKLAKGAPPPRYIPGFTFVKKLPNSSPPLPFFPGFIFFKNKDFAPVRPEVSLYRHHRTGLDFVLIPGGEYFMGNTRYDDGDNQPIHKVVLAPFLLSRTEVTQPVWTKHMGTTPWKGKNYVVTGPLYPAGYISWDEAREFCEKTGLHLPSESQWEYAARGGTKTKFYWGEDEDGRYMWYAKNTSRKGEKYPHQVGLKRANPYGLFDISGNLMEWCRDDYFESYDGVPTDGRPMLIKSSDRKVLRGGNWRGNLKYLSSFNRTWLSPESAHSDIGLRPAARVPQK